MIPDPGSPEARAAGCQCPDEQPMWRPIQGPGFTCTCAMPAGEHAPDCPRYRPGQAWSFAIDCPMHGDGAWQDLNEKDPHMHPCADCGTPTGGDPDVFAYCGSCLAKRFRLL